MAGFLFQKKCFESKKIAARFASYPVLKLPWLIALLDRCALDSSDASILPILWKMNR